MLGRSPRRGAAAPKAKARRPRTQGEAKPGAQPEPKPAPKPAAEPVLAAARPRVAAETKFERPRSPAGKGRPGDQGDAWPPRSTRKGAPPARPRPSGEVHEREERVKMTACARPSRR